MSTSHTTELTEQLVKDYASYAKVDWDDQASVLFNVLYCVCLKNVK